jgi:DNA segregation ATPase FtsK/SpoIIIE and related proteins
VAGTTGSGKSEFLRSLVAGLSIANGPGDVAFLLIDYKGGATFADCSRLPHTVGVVTDLDAHLTRRVLRSLDAELRRRELLFAQVGARDVDQYRTTITPHASLHRLILIVDEFAALAEELPDFLDGLIDIAQRGRSLGIHLILATQRPGGVISPEIRANTAFASLCVSPIPTNLPMS